MFKHHVAGLTYFVVLQSPKIIYFNVNGVLPRDNNGRLFLPQVETLWAVSPWDLDCVLMRPTDYYPGSIWPNNTPGITEAWSGLIDSGIYWVFTFFFEELDWLELMLGAMSVGQNHRTIPNLVWFFHIKWHQLVLNVIFEKAKVCGNLTLNLFGLTSEWQQDYRWRQ